MAVVSSTCDEPMVRSVAREPDLTQGAPCVFKGCRGAYHAGTGAVGVVLCAPWGYEALATRKSWRLLAEAVARAGFPCLRFDYPHTGESVGTMEEASDVATWTRSIGAAADFLRAYSGVKRFVFIGQSIGAALAVEAAAARTDVDGLLLLSPVVRGKTYLADLAAAAARGAEALKITPDRGEGLLGFPLPRALADSLRALDLTKTVPNSVAQVVVFDQADRHAGADVSEHFRRNGIKAVIEPVAPHGPRMSDQVADKPLPATAEQVVATLTRLYPSAPPRIAPRVPLLPATLRADAWREEPLRFGAAGLSGVLCHPARPRPDAPAFVVLNRGLCPRTGWRRGAVDQARALAVAGFTSLRFDAAGIGESPDDPGRPAPRPFSDAMREDVHDAIDAVSGRGFARIALVGHGAGAYLALATASLDERVTEVVAVNPPRLVWNPAETPEDVARYGLRSLADYLGDATGWRALALLIRRRDVLAPALRYFARRRARRLLATIPPRIRRLAGETSLAARARRAMDDLSARGAWVSLVYSAGDPGLDDLRAAFGPRGRELPASCVVSILPDADHNVTGARGSAWLIQHLIAIGGDIVPNEADRAPVVRPRAEVYAPA